MWPAEIQASKTCNPFWPGHISAGGVDLEAGGGDRSTGATIARPYLSLSIGIH